MSVHLCVCVFLCVLVFFLQRRKYMNVQMTIYTWEIHIRIASFYPVLGLFQISYTFKSRLKEFISVKEHYKSHTTGFFDRDVFFKLSIFCLKNEDFP